MNYFRSAQSDDSKESSSSNAPGPSNASEPEEAVLVSVAELSIDDGSSELPSYDVDDNVDEHSDFHDEKTEDGELTDDHDDKTEDGEDFQKPVNQEDANKESSGQRRCPRERRGCCGRRRGMFKEHCTGSCPKSEDQGTQGAQSGGCRRSQVACSGGCQRSEDTQPGNCQSNQGSDENQRTGHRHGCHGRRGHGGHHGHCGRGGHGHRGRGGHGHRGGYCGRGSGDGRCGRGSRGGHCGSESGEHESTYGPQRSIDSQLMCGRGKACEPKSSCGPQRPHECKSFCRPQNSCGFQMSNCRSGRFMFARWFSNSDSNVPASDPVDEKA